MVAKEMVTKVMATRETAMATVMATRATMTEMATTLKTSARSQPKSRRLAADEH